MKKILVNNLFLTGLAIRLALIFLITPIPVAEWYLPFLSQSVQSINPDPWDTWIVQGGSPTVFPYGYCMWMVFLPSIALFTALQLPLELGYGLSLLVADGALLLVLRKLVPGKDRLLLAVYWLSPIVIVATYVLGFNDLIPVLVLTYALFQLRNHRPTVAGLFCIFAISAKLSMVLALPFCTIYFLHNRAQRRFALPFMKGMAIGASLLLMPFLTFSPSGVDMVFSNPEIDKVYRVAVSLGGNVLIYVVPLIYLLMLYAAWRVKRMSFDLFEAFLGMSFLLVVLFTPGSPGWFIWAVPLLVTYQARSDHVAIALTSLFSLLYVGSAVVQPPYEAQLATFVAPWNLNVPTRWVEKLPSLLQTTMVATGMVLAVRIWRTSVSRNDFFRLSRKPFVIGIAGDSGAGKDSFSDALKGLFGSHSVATLSGDDYHLWDRQKPMWQVMTHLNPRANDLEGFASDLVSLTDGRSVQSRHYDHSTGRMSRPFRIGTNDIIIASGLHALYLPILRKCFDLSVYLDIDERLRRHFKLKRDVYQRGHPVDRVLASFERREPDAARFIRPQKSHADLVLSLQPIHPRMLEAAEDGHPLRFKLVVRSRHGLDATLLTRVLVGVCGLHVDMQPVANASELELTIEGEASAPDISLAALMTCPRLIEFLDVQPRWEDGMMGLMQLVALAHINHALTKRFI